MDAEGKGKKGKRWIEKSLVEDGKYVSFFKEKKKRSGIIILHPYYQSYIVYNNASNDSKSSENSLP